MPLVLTAPPSKSLTHRALILAAQCPTPCTVEGPLLGADCRSTAAVLAALGAPSTPVPGGLRFAGATPLRPPSVPLDCGNSGTTLRLMAGQCARLPGPSTLTGDASLRARPNGPLLAALAARGATVESTDGRAPLTVSGPLQPGTVHLGPRVSSQYASSLLLALALGPAGTSTLHLAAPVSSRPYLALTAAMAAHFGIRWTSTEDENGLHYTIPGDQRPQADAVRIAGDWSSAAFPLVGAAVQGVGLRLENVDADSPQGDKAILGLLARTGLALAVEPGAVTLSGRATAPLGTVGLDATPDMFPALCALAAVLPGESVLAGAPSLRHKESDRIAMMARGLTQLGVPCRELADGLVVQGGGPIGREGETLRIESAHDHRIYMAFRLLSLVARGTVAVDGAGCEAVSYPDFEAHRARLAAARG